MTQMVSTSTKTGLDRNGKRRMVVVFFSLFLNAMILFAAAGTLNWPAAWLYFGLGLGAYAIGGAIIIEQVFNWQGMGTLFLEANSTNDYPLMMGIMLFLSAFAILANLVTELFYVVLDPRVTVGDKR